MMLVASEPKPKRQTPKKLPEKQDTPKKVPVYVRASIRKRPPREKTPTPRKKTPSPKAVTP